MKVYLEHKIDKPVYSKGMGVLKPLQQKIWIQLWN